MADRYQLARERHRGQERIFIRFDSVQAFQTGAATLAGNRAPDFVPLRRLHVSGLIGPSHAFRRGRPWEIPRRPKVYGRGWTPLSAS